MVEIHGHGGRSSHYDIEISSGSLEKNRWSMKMAAELTARISNSPALGDYSLSGDFNRIYFTAKKSFSITASEWMAFHIELPRSIRASEGEYLPFCKALAETTKGLLADIDGFSEDRTANRTG